MSQDQKFQKEEEEKSAGKKESNIMVWIGFAGIMAVSVLSIAWWMLRQSAQ